MPFSHFSFSKVGNSTFCGAVSSRSMNRSEATLRRHAPYVPAYKSREVQRLLLPALLSVTHTCAASVTPFRF